MPGARATLVTRTVEVLIHGTHILGAVVESRTIRRGQG